MTRREKNGQKVKEKMPEGMEEEDGEKRIRLLYIEWPGKISPRRWDWV